MIRDKVNKLYDKIVEATNELELIREQCSHRNVEEKLYAWAPGHTYPAMLCTECDKVIVSLDGNFIPSDTVTYPVTLSNDVEGL